jgi:hypothetical protein
MLQFQAILRAGFFANSTGIAEFMTKKKLVGIVSSILGNGQSSCLAIHRTEAATRTLLFINDGDHITLGPEHPQ